MKKGKSAFKPSRRQFLLSSASASVAFGASSAFGANAFGGHHHSYNSNNFVSQDFEQESRTLDEIYQAAIAEGGKLVIYAGGDIDSQQDPVRQAFQARFPEIELEIVVDYSKYHDVRVDNQLETNTLVPDVVQLQTLQDFERWKCDNRLLNYKPLDFENVYPGLRDRDGAWCAVGIIPFSFAVDLEVLGDNAPMSPKDLINSEWKGQIASSYPNDDDAVEFLFKMYTEAYGWDWLAALAEQDLQFKRGTNSASEALANKEKPIALGVGGSAVTAEGSTTQWVLPESEPFMAWGQRAGIMKDASHPEAAKLYMNWVISDEVQSFTFSGWTIRQDISPRGGLKHIWEYPNANFPQFPEFMRNRMEVELWRQTFSLYFGEVTGDPSPGWLGLHPGA
ncbi:hypothetical protein VA7868_01456 [Vibrio aerogenes CECT 7868]|uniref:Bacterial extracellular solute-binding protein n=1 Tax=Vibrio aerogenes CECT 7868 TaxID=1216006 RepID=A0A1M5Y2R9_9VIBR|nr:ABC transporter substrate-binding protein [Vibrio aerogenes]SHI06302.1 hypothetical protein VA7868_01456 [Vibrio aerogenes CECT 7868]